jgi:hypothetical protein
MANDLTAKLDALREEVERLLATPKRPPKERAALTEIAQLLSEAADAVEEAEL